jgi:chromosome segregation ATPase
MRTKRTGAHRTAPLSILVLIFALGLFSFVSAAWSALATPDSEEITNLLSELKSEAIQLRADAEEMKSFTMNSKLSWQSHASKLTSIKENVNNSGQLLSKLQNVRATAPPWQQTIDQAIPLLKDLADQYDNRALE